MPSVGRRQWLTVVCLCVISLGCGLKPSATPESTFEAMREAFASGDFGAVYDLMSADAQKMFADDLAKQADKMKDAPDYVKQVMGFDFAEVAKRPAREAFAEVMRGIRGVSKLGKAMSGKEAARPDDYSKAKLKKCQVNADAAALTLDVSGAETKLELVRVEGIWKISTAVWPTLGK